MNQRAFILLAGIIICAFTSSAQVPFESGGPTAALSGASMLESDVWAVHNDPAALGFLKKPVAGIWSERPYNIKQLNLGALACAYPLKKGEGGCIGVGFYVSNANAGFTRQKINLSYGLRLSSALSAGISVHVLQTRLSEFYGSRLTPIADAALIYKITGSVSVGLRAWNIYPVLLSEYQNERLPSVFQLGIRHRLGKKVAVSAQAAQETGQKTGLGFGVSYRPVPGVLFQAGIRTQPGSYSFGVAFLRKDLSIHLAFAVHPILGTSPNLSFVYGRGQDEL